MDKVAVFLDSFFNHAETTVYDPVKAHEYYLKNRELQGRQSGSDLKTERKKQGWAYSKNVLNEAKKEELTKASKDKVVAIEQIRQTAQERRIEISDKLKNMFDQITQARKTVIDQIAERRAQGLQEIADNRRDALLRIEEDTQKKIDALPPIPKGLSKEDAQKLSKERSDKLDKIRGDASDARDTANTMATQKKNDVRNQASEERASVSSEVSNLKSSEKDSASSEREQIGAEMKANIDSARDNYESLKSDLKAKYDTKLQQEFEAIRENV